MIEFLSKKFYLTRKGAKDLFGGIVFSTLSDIALMLPVGVIVLVLNDMLQPLVNNLPLKLNLWKFIAMIIGTLTILFIVNWIQYNSVYNTVYKESSNRRVNLAEKLRKLPLSFFGQKDLSDLTNTIMTDCTDLEHVFSHAIPQFVGAVISTILMGIGMLIYDWRIGIALLWVTPISFMIVILTKRLQNKASEKNINSKRKVAEGIQECLEVVRDLKAYNEEKNYMERLDAIIADAEKTAIKSELVTGILVVSGQMILKIGFATVILIGGVLFATGKTTLLVYLVFLIAASRFYDPLCNSLINLADIFSSQLKTERMKNMERQPCQKGKEKYELNGYDIEFKNVEFAYDKDKQVLKNVSFTAKQSQVTALVGLSGGGKSTAAKLTARFWDVTSGKITLGGVNINSVEPEALLENFSIVFQDVLLFNDTIMNNIRIGRRDATDDEVMAAAKAANCEDFIYKMSKGYETIIGENGSTLSGGERQRVSIARALLKDAPIILLDEATASLDVENETKIQTAISNLVKNKTVLVIAHRLRTVAGADKIVVLNDGKIAEQGTSIELLEKKGIYEKMVRLQQESLEWAIK